MVTLSRQDQEAVRLLETRTVRVDVDRVQRYANPLLRVRNMPCLHTPKDAVLPTRRKTQHEHQPMGQRS